MASYKMVFAGFLLLLSFVLTTQLPLQEGDPNPLHIEQARDLWNRAKEMKRILRPRVVRRQTLEAPPEDITQEIELLESEGAPKYILELYKNLSAVGVKQPETQANTIRSLKTTSKSPVCGEYNFSLSAIDPKELFTSAELRLFLKPALNSLYDDTQFLVSVEKFKHGSAPVRITTEPVMGSESGWVVFRVETTVSEWVQNDVNRHNKHHGFRVQVYSSFLSTANGEDPYPCSEAPLQFVTSKDSNTDNHPLLMVYTYDPDAENIDYSMLSTMVAIPPTTESQVGKRRVSRTTQEPSCNVHPLEVTNGDLNDIPLIKEHIIHLPTSYNAGICGGQCRTTFPDEPQHAQLIHLLILRNKFQRHGYSFTQCCAPVQYHPLDVLSVSSTGVVQINRLKNMKIKRCECIDIATFSS